jgi:hypothetical protein
VPRRRTSGGIGRQVMRACAAPAPHAAWCLRSTAGHQPATTPRPVHRSALACPALLVSPLSMPQSKCSKGDVTPTAVASGCAHVAIPCALDMGDHGQSWAGAARLGAPATQERVCVRERWRATVWVSARDAPPVDALTTPLADAPSRRIRRSLGAPPASMGAHGVITARPQLAGRTVTAQAVLASAAHRSVQPSRVPTLEVLLTCPGACARPRHQHNARASSGSFSVPFRITIDEKTPAEHHHQIHGPATRFLAGAAGGGWWHAPGGPGTPAAVATLRAPRCVRAQWWAGSRISSGPSSG